MSLRRNVGRMAASMALAVAPLAVGGAAAPVPEPRESTQGAGPLRHVVTALGDSVPSGAACFCAPFPTIFGSLLSQRAGGSVSVGNFAVDGLDTSGLLAQFDQPQVIEAVRRSDVILMTIGANDFGDRHDQVVQDECTADATADCVGDELDLMRARLARALSDIRALRRGQPTSVLVTGYWNVFEDGEVARRAFQTDGLQASIQLTRRVNEAISSVSTSNGAHYVDLFGPFQRLGRSIDSLLAADGNHPNAAGHRLIARALLEAGLPLIS